MAAPETKPRAPKADPNKVRRPKIAIRRLERRVRELEAGSLCFHAAKGERCTRYLEGAEGELAEVLRWLRSLPHDAYLKSWIISQLREGLHLKPRPVEEHRPSEAKPLAPSAQFPFGLDATNAALIRCAQCGSHDAPYVENRCVLHVGGQTEQRSNDPLPGSDREKAQELVRLFGEADNKESFMLGLLSQMRRPDYPLPEKATAAWQRAMHGDDRGCSCPGPDPDCEVHTVPKNGGAA